MVTAHVIVRLKPGISDPEGQNTTKALQLLGFGSVQGAHTTRIWDIELSTQDKAKAKKEVDEMCRRLLTNPVIHDFEIRVD